MTSIKSVSLYCTEGSSDKEYHVMLEEGDGGYLVNTAHGRRGRAMKPGTKTKTPVTLEAATKIYDKLVKAKMSDGYTEAESGARYVGTDLEERDSGLSPMLPTAITMAELARLTDDPAWVFQEKFDGENRILVSENGILKGVNRRGLFCSMRAEWSDSAPTCAEGRTVIAGEDMGTRFVAFDLIEHNGQDVSRMPLRDRKGLLAGIALTCPWMEKIETAYDTQAKRAMIARVKAEGGEGIVAKRLDAPYTGGRSTDHLKFKFQETATFEVTRVNDQRSVALGLYAADGSLEDLGNVTIPANHDIPAVGDLVEVEYMMRYEAGALMQPKYKGRRDDISDKPFVDQITRIKPKMAA